MSDAAPPDSGMRPRDPAEASPRLLSRRRLWLCFAASMLVFLFTGGPIWRHPWQIDASAFYSYVVIPPLVIAALLFERNLTWVAFGLGAMEVVVWKFGTTYVLAHAIWMIVPPPPDPAPARPPVVAPIVPEPVLLAVDPAKTGTVEGIVRTLSGDPRADALVVIDRGLEGYAFSPPSEPITVLDAKGSIFPLLQAAQVGQEVRAHSGDRLLHTIVATTEDGDLFSIPLQSSGAISAVRLTTGKGVATLHCGVHQKSGESALLVVVDSPFIVRTGEDGRFRFTGVPAVTVELTSYDADRRSSTTTLVEPTRVASVALAF